MFDICRFFYFEKATLCFNIGRADGQDPFSRKFVGQLAIEIVSVYAVIGEKAG